MSELNEQTQAEQQRMEQTQAEQPETTVVAEQDQQPKWVKLVEKISIWAIVAAGLLSVLFMFMLGFSVNGKTMMLSDLSKNINEISDTIEKLGNSSDSVLTAVGALFGELLYNVYVMMGMSAGIIAGIVCGIILVIKTIKFVAKKETNIEKTAITSCLFFFAFAVIVLSLAICGSKGGFEDVNVAYSGLTVAGLVICGLLFLVYFAGKLALNYKKYLQDKKTLINACMNLGWALIATLTLAVLSCAPVVIAEGDANLSFGFNRLSSNALGMFIKGMDTMSDETLNSLGLIYSMGFTGMAAQIWLIFQSGKSLHKAIRGTVSAENTVKLGSQIWRLVLSLVILLASVSVANEEISMTYEGCTAVLAAPVVIFIFSIIGLVLAIVNRVLITKEIKKQSI